MVVQWCRAGPLRLLGGVQARDVVQVFCPPEIPHGSAVIQASVVEADSRNHTFCSSAF